MAQRKLTAAGFCVALVAAGGALCACAASHGPAPTVTAARPALRPADVRLYLEPPAQPYETIAALSSSSKYSWSLTSAGKSEVVIERLKKAAAKLGANGVLLEEIADGPATAVGTRIGTEYEGNRGIADLSIGATTLLSQKYGRATAIFIAPAPAVAPGR